MALLPRTDSELEAVVKEGWLFKEGGATKNKWQSRWFVLQPRALHWYTKKGEAAAQGSVFLSDVQDVSLVGEHSSRKHSFSLVTTKSNAKKVYYLSAETEEETKEWYKALEQQWLSRTLEPRLVKYATTDVFLTQGVRVTGDVDYGILTTLSNRVPPERKRRDNLGWFCDSPVTISAILNLFSEYGWTPERVYRSTSPQPADNTLHPVLRVIFSKTQGQAERKVGDGSGGGGDGTTGERALETSSSQLRSGIFDSVRVSNRPVRLSIPRGAQALEGSDDELARLMQEFGIPLSLLVVPTSAPKEL